MIVNCESGPLFLFIIYFPSLIVVMESLASIVPKVNLVTRFGKQQRCMVELCSIYQEKAVFHEYISLGIKERIRNPPYS
jgi:hypothetical protein